MDNGLAHPVAAGLYLVNIDGGISLPITSGHYVVAAWSPDGRQIAAINYPNRHYLVVMNTDGTNKQRLIDMDGYGYDSPTPASPGTRFPD